MSSYDIWAVWHSGFMQKLAKYQMQEVKVFAGLFIPYMVKGTKQMLMKARKTGRIPKGLKITVAILGGGDLIFPLLCAGTFYFSYGLAPALWIIAGSTLALTYLLYSSQKGKFYPALPYLTVGCMLGYLLSLL
jgi:presenilin-like A22 family membrane protease